MSAAEPLHESRAGKPPKQWQRILRILMSGRRLTRLDAEAEGCHALPSTISGIQKHGVRIDRQLVERPGRFGTVTVLAEYWLDSTEIENARRVLGGS